MKIIARCLSFLCLLATSTAIGQNATVAFHSSINRLKLGGHGYGVQLILDGTDWAGVLRVANDLARDFGRVTGTNGSVTVSNSTTTAAASVIFNVTNLDSFSFNGSNTAKGGVIIAGTIGKSSLINELVKTGKIDTTTIEGQWEAFSSSVVKSPIPGVDSALVIVGSDKRGTIYGLYDLSEQIGVSAWYWWADVPTKTHDSIFALNVTKIQKSPSVKYRGFFLNDEAPALTGWINAKYPPAKYGPGYNADFYSKVFELLLRLRANYIWPAGADWGQTFFVDDDRNQALADAYGIVMGTSHTEPMARATKEWNLFGKGPWQWNVNNASIAPFMKEGAERAKPYENVITIGMRGSGDTALGPTIESSLLENIVDTERQILAAVYGSENVTKVPQAWCLYKEVQGFYEAGMRVPDDVTLLWADDNWGNIRRLPVSTELNRTGGAGVYFHFDYVGDPRDYKWVNTIQLQRTWEQLHLAYKRQARTIWVVNVGDLKPLEIPISHFFDLAYDITLWGADSSSTWLKMWATREFGEELADDVANILNQYSRLAGRRKFELLEPSTYSVINYEEVDMVLQEWNSMAEKAQDLYDELDEDYKAAFFELILHPILGGATVYDIHFSSAKNRIYAGQWRNSANYWADHLRERFDDDNELTVRYNTLLGGKWEHQMDQTHIGYTYWQQPMRQVTPPVQYVQIRERALTGDLGVTTEGTNASIPGDDNFHPLSSNTLTMLPIDPYMATKRYIDVFNIGINTIKWNISAASYVKLSQPSSSLSPKSNDVRVYVDIDWNSAPAGSSTTVINITSSTDYGAQFSMPSLILPINHTSVPTSFTRGFIESDATISIEAEHYSIIRGNSTGATYLTIPNFGRTLSGVTLYPPTAPSQSAPLGPALEYDLYTFTPTTSSKPANITIILGTGLNSDPTRPLRYAVAIDDQPPKTVQYIVDQPAGALPLGWSTAVSDAAWKSTTNTTISAGAHKLRLWALEPAVTFQKIIIDLGGVRSSYLGPPESYRL